MDQHQTEGLNNDVNLGDDITKNSTSNNLQNGTNSSTNAPGRNTTGLMQQQIQQQQTQHSRTIHQQNPPTNMNEKNPSSNPKSPPTGHHGGASNSGSGGNEPQSHQYGNEPGLMHYQSPPMPQHTGATVIGAGIEHPNKDDPYSQTNPGAPHPYSRYHSDPNAGPPDPYGRYGHAVAMQGCKPSPMMSANRPPQRYIPGQPPQGPTPTLNSLLQSHPPPHQTHRYPNSYDPQQQSALQQAPSQPYGQQQGWAPPPRPFSPQLGPAQSYRSTPPASSRGQSPYPPTGQNPNSYPPSPQQGGPPPPPNQCPPVTSQYSPYPQRYPTPPGPAGGPNHRSAYSSAHQYPDQNRPWPGGAGGPSPAASPGPGGHPHPPSSPHQTQTHGGPPPSSPGHAPSPSPQPPQASPSPHQYPSRPSQASTPNTNESESAGELTGQNSNDSSCGAVSNVGSGPPGTPNQQTLRPTPSPTSSSGSRSMSPAVGQQNLPLPPRGSSSQSQPGMTQMPPSSMGLISNSNSLANAQHHPHHQPPHLQPQPHHQQQAQQQQQQQQQPSDPPPGPGSRPPPPNINSQVNPQQPQPQQHQQHPSPHPQQQGNQTGNNMTAQGSYQTAPPTISHMHGYKIGASPGQNPGPTPPNMPPYRPQSQQYSQDNYTSRPQYGSAYGATPPTGQPPPVNNVPPGPGQYAGRPLPNHVGGPHSQFPPYQQNWAPSSPQTQATMMSNHVQGKGTPPPSQVVINSPRPLNYLKQHLQHKGGYIGAPSPTPPQGFGNGPTMHPPMGPPHHMGPPMGPSSMGPPTSTPQNNPPSSVVPAPSANCLSDNNSNSQDITSVSQDNGISSSGSSTTSSHPVTSVVTTGPDGAPLDEASQQSTLSNASAASGEDPQCVTPKSRKNEPYNQSHLAPPSASPGAHPHGEEFEMTSPTTWPRAAASPVFNSHVPQETYRSSKKSDSLCKLYDMDDNPDRRGWLDKLLSFMEERRTPITACPTISKQPLDLYRLYMLVKERGGFVEVCKVTKSKTWKDIAGLLGIGASSSAAYTLRKHYTKNLLAFECHFDRGGIDPGPIIQQVEAGSKKKSTKTTSVPSPAGSSNSQDSFPPPGSAGSSMDGYPGYPSNYPPGAPTDYTSPQQIPRPPSQNNAQAPHAGNASSSNTENINVSNPFDDPVAASRGPYQQGTTYPPATPRPQGAPPYQGQTGYNQYGTPEQYGPTAGPPGQYPQSQSQFPPPNRTMYPPFGPEGETNTPPTSSSYGTYPPPTRPYTQPPAATTQSQTSVTVAPTAVSATSVTYPTNQTQPDYYRQPEQNAQPRRHPDFAKDTQAPYPPYGQRSQIYAGAWQSGTNQFRGQYPTQPGPQQWSSGQRPTGPPPPNQQPNQWDPNRYPSVGTSPQSYQPNQQWATATAPGNQSSPVRQPQRAGGKPFSMPPPQSGGPKVATPVQQTFAAVNQIQKRDIVFPSDSIEAATPVLYRRKRLTRNDVCPVDPWRIFMSLRSGLLAESTWALDILNILLFDDTAVHYFGLSHLPGLLNLLLDHFQKNLADMFDSGSDATKHRCSWSRLKVSNSNSDNNSDEIDLGQITNLPNPEERVLLLTTTPNYTMVSRKGIPVRIQSAEDDIFVSDQPKKWDYDEDINYQLGAPIGSDPWTYGHTETHSHDGIIDVFKAEIVDIPFARYLKGSDKKDKLEKDLEEDQEDDNFDIKKDNNSTTDNNQNSKRKYSSKNGLSESIKRIKLKEESAWSASLGSTKCKEEITEVVDQQQGSLPSTIKNEPLDSDCREVDMELEPPKIINGPPSTESSIRDEKDDLENIRSSAASKNDQNSSNTDNTTAVNENNTNSNDKTIFNPKGTMRDPSSTLKRKRMSDYEDECYTRDESSLYLVNESNDTLARRCICLSNIFRNLTFVPGNETVLAKSPTFLAILGKLLLLNHEHLLRTQKTRNYDREEDTDFGDSCSSLQGENEWWWDYLIQIRENMLVACANIAGHLELSRYEEIITRPVLDGLLHWAVCPSAHGQDPFPSCGLNSALSPQRLALEALCKLCVTDANVDLVIATPPFSRLEKLCSVLTRHLCRNEDQVLREFSVNLLHYLAAADSAMSRTVALQSPCISYLVAFIEQAEQTALGVANQHGINYLRENPDSMGTSLDMLRRAAGTLLHLSRHPDNRALFMQQEQRLLGLVMSHILDQQVALIISRVLFQVSRGIGLTNLTEYKLQQKRHYKRNAMDIHQQQHHQINCSHIENIYAGTVTGSSNNNNNSSCSNSLPRSSSPLNSTQSSSLSSSSTLSTSSLSLSSSTQLPGGSQSLDSGTSDNNANTSANCSDGTESNEMKAGDSNVTNSSSSSDSSNSNNSSSNINNNDNNIIGNKNNSTGGSNSNIGDDNSSTTTIIPSGSNNTNTNISTASEVSGGSNISSSGNITTSITSTATTITTTISSSSSSSGSGSGSGSSCANNSSSTGSGNSDETALAQTNSTLCNSNNSGNRGNNINNSGNNNNNNSSSNNSSSSSSSNSNSNNSGNNNKGNNLSTTASTNSSNNNNSNNKQPTQTTAAVA